MLRLREITSLIVNGNQCRMSIIFNAQLQRRDDEVWKVDVLLGHERGTEHERKRCTVYRK